MELSFFVFCCLKVNQLGTGILSIFRRGNPLERLLIEVVEILAISNSLRSIGSLSGVKDCLGSLFGVPINSGEVGAGECFDVQQIEAELFRQFEEPKQLAVNCYDFVVVELILSKTGGNMSVIVPGLHRDGGAGAEAEFGGHLGNEGDSHSCECYELH